MATTAMCGCRWTGPPSEGRGAVKVSTVGVGKKNSNPTVRGRLPTGKSRPRRGWGGGKPPHIYWRYQGRGGWFIPRG